MFSCVWLYFKKCFKKYFLVFGCVLENTIENTFSTCCSHFLTFSRLPNEYIISFIPQYRNTNKTQKKKSSNPIKSGHFARSRSRSARCFAQSRSTLRAIAIDVKARSWLAWCFARSCSARRRDRDRHGASWDCDRHFARSRLAWCFATVVVIDALHDRDRRGASRSWVCIWLGDRTTVKDRRWGELGVTQSELDRCEFWWLSSLLSLALSLLRVTWKWFEGKVKV